MFQRFVPVLSLTAASLVLVGCATSGGALQQQRQYPNQSQQYQNDAGVVTQETSRRDGSLIVNLTPGRMVAENSARAGNTRLGALWTSATSENVAIILMNSTLGGLQSVDIVIDGSGTRWTPQALTGPEAGNYNQPSSSAVIVPYHFVQRMASGRNVRIRVQGPRGYEDASFSTQRASNGSAMSVTNIYDFLNRVDAVRRTTR